MSDFLQVNIFVALGAINPGLMSLMGLNLIMNMFAKNKRQRFERQTAPKALGFYTSKLPWGFRSACYEALQRAEANLGRPVYTVEVGREFKSTYPNIGVLFIMIALQELYKKDEVLGDHELNLWTLNPAH